MIKIFFSYSSKINAMISEDISDLEKNPMICSQRAMLPIQLGVTARCRFDTFFYKILTC
jgi:hypothetical protein